MTGNRRFDSMEMFRHACAFADCADFCSRESWSIVNRTKWYGTPEIVNRAFACEIYLKTLLFYNCIAYTKVHRLAELYALLPQKYQEIIECETVCHFRRTKNALGISYIENISNAFYDWRYSFEKRSLHCEVGYLDLLCDVLKDLCCRELYQISWKEYEATHKER